MAQGESSQEQRPGPAPSRSSRGVVLPVLLVLAIVIPIAFYLMIVRPPQRERYFTESRVRDLAVLSEQIQGALQARLDAMRSASWRGADWQEAVRQIRLEPMEGQRCEPKGSLLQPTPTASSAPSPNPQHSRQERVTVHQDQAPAETPQVDVLTGLFVALDSASCEVRSTAPTAWSALPAATTSETKMRAAVYFRAERGSPPGWASTSTSPTTPTVAGSATSASPSPPSCTPTPVKVCGKSDLSQIVEPFIAGTEIDGFDVFIASGDGTILFERGPAGVGLTHLPAAGPSAAATPADAHCPSAVQGLPAIGELTQSSSVRNVMLSGTCYTLVAQPVGAARIVPTRPPQTPGATDRAAPANATWVVGMLLPKDMLDVEARSVSLGSWTTVPLLLLLIVLAMPAFKLAFIGSRAPFTARDVRVLFFLTLVALGIGVGALIENLSYAWLESQLDTQLASLSEQIRYKFDDEVGRAYDALDLFAAVRGTPRAAAVHDPGPGSPDPKQAGICNGENDYYRDNCRARRCGLTSLFTVPSLRCPPYGEKAKNGHLSDVVQSVSGTPPRLCDQFLQSPGTASACAAVCTKLWGDGAVCPGGDDTTAQAVFACLAEIDPYFDMLVLTDDNGVQLEKWTAAKDITTLVSIADFQSFKDVKGGNLWTLAGGVKAVVHVQRSPNTAAVGASLSRPLIDNRGHWVGAAVGVAEFMSVAAPVLPPGFGAAVIQSNGKVVFHSDASRSLYEDFFSETTEPQPLAAAVAARHAALVETHYHGRSHRMYVHPLERSPWTLIVYRDKELPRTLDLDITATWLVLYVIYLAVLLSLWLVVRWFVRADDGEWVWPDAGRSHVYWIACGTLIALGVANVAVILWGGGDSIGRLLCGSAGPFIAMAVVVLALAPRLRPNGVSEERATARRRLRQLAWAVLLLGGLAVTLGFVYLRTWIAVTNLLAVYAGAAIQAAMSWPDAVKRLCASLRLTGAVIAVKTRVGALHRHWRGVYVALGVAILVVVGVLPSIATFKDAFDLGISTWVRHGQLGIALALAEREHRIRDSHRKEWTPALVQARLRENLDAPRADVFTNAEFGIDGAGPGPAPHASAGWADHIVAGVDAIALAFGLPCAETPGGTAQWNDYCRLSARYVTGLVMATLPVYHPESGQLSEMLFDRSSDGRWSFDAVGVTVKDPRLVDHGGTVRLQRAAVLPRGPVYPPSIPGVVLVLGIALALAGMYFLMRWYATKVFDLQHVSESKGSDDGTWIRGQGLLLINPSVHLRQLLGQLLTQQLPDRSQDVVSRIDLCLPKDKRPEPISPGLTIVDHLEHQIDDGKYNHEKLALLESLVLSGARCVVLSTVDPLQYVRHRVQSHGDDADSGYATDEEIDSWARVLDRFLKVSLPLSGASETVEERVLGRIEELRQPVTDGPQRLKRADWKAAVLTAVRVPVQPTLTAEHWIEALLSECWWTPRLRGLAVEAAKIYEPQHRPLECIRDIARAHYRTLWAELTDHQKLILFHLAREGFVNPHNWRALSRLIERGLVRRAPAVRLMNESFAEFVQRVELPEQVQHWEHADGPSAWDQIRGVVVVVSVLVALVLSQTQPQMLTYLATGLTAAAGFGVTVTNFLGSLQARRAGAAPPSSQ